MLLGTKIRGALFCVAMFVASFSVSHWILNAVSPHAANEIATYAGFSAAIPAGLIWYKTMSKCVETRMNGLGIGFVSAVCTFPILGLFGMIAYIIGSLQDGAKLTANLIANALAGGIGFVFFASIAGSLFALPIGAALGFLFAKNVPINDSK